MRSKSLLTQTQLLEQLLRNISSPPKELKEHQESKEMQFKPASRKDMKAIAGIIRSSATWYEPFVDEKDLDEHYVGEKWISENYTKRDFYLGKNKKGENLGTISLQFFDDITYLGYIYLDTNHTGKGYGKKFIDFAKKKSIEKGQEAMILIAHPEATWAVKAYERYGFELLHKSKEEVIQFKDGLLESYYEEGFHLYQYKL